MFLESKLITSVLSLVILFLSFMASFKHQNAAVFIVGLGVSVLLHRCDAWYPHLQGFIQQQFAADDTTETFAAALPPPTTKKALTAAESKPVTPEEVKQLTIRKQEKKDMRHDASSRIDAQFARELMTGNVDYLEHANQQRSVFGFGRPTQAEVMTGKGDIRNLTPDFTTFAHLLVGNLRIKNDPVLPVLHPSADAKIQQNPEVLKLVPKNSNLEAAKDFFPTCRDVLRSNDGTIAPDPRGALRCPITSGVY